MRALPTRTQVDLTHRCSPLRSRCPWRACSSRSTSRPCCRRPRAAVASFLRSEAVKSPRHCLLSALGGGGRSKRTPASHGLKCGRFARDILRCGEPSPRQLCQRQKRKGGEGGKRVCGATGRVRGARPRGHTCPLGWHWGCLPCFRLFSSSLSVLNLFWFSRFSPLIGTCDRGRAPVRELGG